MGLWLNPSSLDRTHGASGARYRTVSPSSAPSRRRRGSRSVSFSHSFTSLSCSSVYLHVISSWPLVGDEKIYFIGAKRRRTRRRVHEPAAVDNDLTRTESSLSLSLSPLAIVLIYARHRRPERSDSLGLRVFAISPRNKDTPSHNVAAGINFSRPRSGERSFEKSLDLLIRRNSRRGAPMVSVALETDWGAALFN